MKPGRLETTVVVCVLVCLIAHPYLTGGQPIGELALNDPLSLENAAPSAGDQIKQLLLSGLYAIPAGLVLFRFRLQVILFLGGPLLLLLAWTLSSIAWSIDPDLSLRRCVALVGTVTTGLYIGLRFDQRSMPKMLVMVGVIALSASLLLGWIDPVAAVDNEGRLRGATAHKNELGSLSALMLTLCLDRMLNGSLSSLPLGLLGSLCLLLAHSASPLPVLVLSTFTLIGMLLLRISDAGSRALFPVIGCLAAGTVIWALTNADAIARVMGRDPDMSGRTFVWDFVLQCISQRFYLGYGFGAFWLGQQSPAPAFWANTNLGAVHAHNGFLQLALDVGIIGPILFFSVMLATGSKLVWLLFKTKYPMIPWTMSFLVFLVISNVAENWLWEGNAILVCLFVALVVRTNISYRNATTSGSSVVCRQDLRSVAFGTSRRRRPT